MSAPLVSRQEFHTCDVSDPHQVHDAVTRVIDTLGGVDILVNNAGLLEEPRSLREVTADQLHTYYATNAVGPLLMVRSEERRVGKEGRYRLAAKRQDKKWNSKIIGIDR